MYNEQNIKRGNSLGRDGKYLIDLEDQINEKKERRKREVESQKDWWEKRKDPPFTVKMPNRPHPSQTADQRPDPRMQVLSLQEELKIQMELKKKREAEEKAREREEEAKLERRIQEQQERMKREFDEEQAKKKAKEQAKLKRQEDMAKRQQEIQKEAERAKKEDRMRSAILRAGQHPFNATVLIPPRFPPLKIPRGIRVTLNLSPLQWDSVRKMTRKAQL